MATITIAIMDPPYESANTTTAFRLADAALRKGHHLNVFCYEGATALGFAGQKQHANAVHGASVEEEDHPNPKEWVKGLVALAAEKGVALVWCNCGLCVDERGVENQVEGTSRGSPVDAWKFCEASDGVLFIGTE
jgi:sulfur relay (sulfurtransferase) complex TusBCD TusD component (DsrE family)